MEFLPCPQCQTMIENDDNNKSSFTRIGYFRSENESHCFDIYYRKLKFKEEALEFLINDISEIMISEKMKIETQYKQKVLAKIAHEFKTPLITITSLINKINEELQIVNENRVKSYLKHVNNLSNYTIILINDIIQYSSKSIDLRLSKIEIKIREKLDI